MLQYTYHKKLNIFLVLSLLAAPHRAASVCTAFCTINKTRPFGRLFCVSKKPHVGALQENCDSKFRATGTYIQYIGISRNIQHWTTRQHHIICRIYRLFSAVSDFKIKVGYSIVYRNKRRTERFKSLHKKGRVLMSRPYCIQEIQRKHKWPEADI